MFFSILKKAFIRWWDKMGYTFLTSILGAINPFYLYIIVLGLSWLLARDKSAYNQSLEWFALIVPPMMLMTPVFPTSFAAIAVQQKVIDFEVVYFKDYFREYFKAFRPIIKPSLLLTLIYGISGFILSYAALFYVKIIPHPVFKVVLIVVFVWLFIFVMLSEFVLLPLIIYNPELKLKNAFLLSFKMVVAKGVLVFGIALINAVIYILLILSRALGLFFYFGISSHLRLYTHKEIIAFYAPKKEEKEDNDVQASATREAWKQVLQRFEDRERESN